MRIGVEVVAIVTPIPVGWYCSSEMRRESVAQYLQRSNLHTMRS
jgi:hypothetical protein